MLKNIPPLLSPDLLHALRSMGHGDRLAIVDANYPAASAGPRLVRLDGHPATDVLAAVLEVMPLDDFVDDAAVIMAVVGDPGRTEPIMTEFEACVQRYEPEQRLMRLERFDFYEAAAGAFAMVATGESRLYGNIILRKGVIRPD